MCLSIFQDPKKPEAWRVREAGSFSRGHGAVLGREDAVAVRLVLRPLALVPPVRRRMNNSTIHSENV